MCCIYCHFKYWMVYTLDCFFEGTHPLLLPLCHPVTNAVLTVMEARHTQVPSWVKGRFGAAAGFGTVWYFAYGQSVGQDKEQQPWHPYLCVFSFQRKTPNFFWRPFQCSIDLAVKLFKHLTKEREPKKARTAVPEHTVVQSRLSNGERYVFHSLSLVIAHWEDTTSISCDRLTTISCCYSNSSSLAAKRSTMLSRYIVFLLYLVQKCTTSLSQLLPTAFGKQDDDSPETRLNQDNQLKKMF